VDVRPWVAAARPKAALLLLAIGNVTPETAANMIADNLEDEAFSDLLTDMETGTTQEFLARFRDYFGLEDFDDATTKWMHELVEAVNALVDDEPAEVDGGEHAD